MPSLFGINLKALVVLVGVSFFGLTLYSEEIIASLERNGLVSSNRSGAEKPSPEEAKRITKLQDSGLSSQELEERQSKLKEIEQKFYQTEVAFNILLQRKKEIEDRIEKLKFELVDQENKKKLVEDQSSNLLDEIKRLKGLNKGQQEKILQLDNIKTEMKKLASENKNLIVNNRALEEEAKNMPNRKVILEKSEELEKKIVRLTEQLSVQKRLIQDYEVKVKTSTGSKNEENVLTKPDYKRTMLELKEEHKRQIDKLNNEIKRIGGYQGNFEELNGIKVVFSGFMGYDLGRKEIIFMTREGQKIMMVQDNFTGALVGECGLPVISSEDETRCAATIIARLLFHKNGPIMKGLEIVEVRKK
tara:strand:+ start:287 stop:1366 length:1080 start_codon:yes stop_codon:yes gene_type:complete